MPSSSLDGLVAVKIDARFDLFAAFQAKFRLAHLDQVVGRSR